MTPRGKSSPKNKGKSKKRKASTRKPGAQPGNTNALRHGFYAHRFTASESKRLNNQKPGDVQSEIALVRVCIDRLVEQLDFDAVFIPGKDENGAPVQGTIRDDHYLRQLNTLSQMTQSLATLTRTEHLLKGKHSDVTDAIQNALEELRMEMGL